MKKLLIPTDFSPAANLAIDYAIDIANQFGSNVTLLHTYQVMSTTGSFVSIERYLKEDAEQEMTKTLNSICSRFKHGASVRSEIINGPTVSVISKLADNANFDLIIMGTQGASGITSVFTGSTTNAVIKNAETPVLVIPEKAVFRPIKNIVFAVDDYDISSAGVVSALTQMARRYQAKVLVYHLDRGESDNAIDPTVSMYMDGLETSYHFEMEGGNVNDSINQFLIDYNGDLLCMIQRDRGFFDRLFHSSVTKKEIFSSQVPLLIMHDDTEWD